MKIALCLIVTVTLATPAHADWQYTKWGMTPAQVIAASKGKIKVAQSVDSKTKGAEGPYSSGPRNFSANIHFQNSKLSSVILTSEPGNDCYVLRNDLVNLYGAPVSEKEGVLKTARWRDSKKGNIIVWTAIAMSYCALEYSPLSGPDTSGL